MLATVEYGGVKKFITIPQIDEKFDFQKFLQQVTDKFSLQTQLGIQGGLHLFDSSDTEVDADIFDELIKSGVQNFKIGYLQCPEPSTSSSSSSDCTNIPSTMENRKRAMEDWDHYGAKQKTLDPVLSSPSSAANLTPTALSKFGHINNIKSMKQGSPAIYHVTPEPEMVGSLKKIIIGKKKSNMKNKAILLVGETGTGKSTLINALMNQALGVQWEDNVWFHFVENEQPSDGQQRNQTDSQTSDVIVYQLFGFEGKPLPCSLTIIDTPGYGDTRGNDRDDIVTLRLLELFRSGEGVHEISAVGVVLKASENRVSDRLRYIFDSVMSLFGKDMEKNIVALLTHSDGLPPENVLKALEDANVKLAKDEDNEPVHFLFNNRQHLQRTKKTNASMKATWDMTISEMIQFREFVDKRTPQNVQKTVEVLDTRVRLTACIQNLKERITWTEMKQREIKQTEEAVEKHKEEIERNKDFNIEVDEPYKVRKTIKGGKWFFGMFYDGALTCSVCQENCHYPGCTHANSPSSCEVMKDGHCTSCSGKCHVSRHVKEEWVYESKTRKVKMTLQQVKEKHDMNLEEKHEKSNLLDELKKKVQQYQKEKNQFLEEAYVHVLNLDKTALNQNSVSTRVHLDFLIDKMREKGDFGKAKKMEDIRKRTDQAKGMKAAFRYFWGGK